MYQLKYKNYILYDPRLADEKLIVRDPSVKLAVSKAGEMSFTVDAEHPYLSNLRRMSGLVELLDGTLPIYRGRITTDTKDFYGAHKIETEGIMAALNDSIIPPFNFPEDFAEDDSYKADAASGNVVEFFFRWILSQHNAQVTAEQQIKPGVVTVSDPNNYITRSSEEYATAMSTIFDKLIKSDLGGNLLIRYEDDGNYLDYYAALPLTNTQTVEFAENLIDLSSETDVTWETCTPRKWLNNDFLGAAFSADEKAMIPTITVSADKNPRFSTNPGNATQDQVFLLSITEANKYFSSNSARQCEHTDFAVANGSWERGSGNCDWWLRSPGSDQDFAANVETDGNVDDYGGAVDNDYLAVRPALWIDLNS